MFRPINIFQLRNFLILGALLVVLAGCSTGEPPPTAVADVPPTSTPIPTPVVSEPAVNVPSPIAPGQQIGVSINVDSIPDIEIEYKWTHPEGKGSILDGQGTDGITYEAPDEPGTYKIGVVITATGSVFERSTFVTVEEEPTDTPTSTPTEMPTPTDTSSPTVEPMETPTLGPTPPFVTLDNLEDKQNVPCEVSPEGTYSSDITNLIWPVVYIGGIYHPQDEGGEAPLKINGTWTGIARFGNCDDPKEKGNQYQLLIVEAGEQCSQKFEEYFKNWPEPPDECGDRGWCGIDELPEDCKVHHYIRVTRE